MLVCFGVGGVLRCDPFDPDALSALSHASYASYAQPVERERTRARQAIARGRFVILTDRDRLAIYDWISGSAVREHRCGAESAHISPDGRTLCYTYEDEELATSVATFVYA